MINLKEILTSLPKDKQQEFISYLEKKNWGFYDIIISKTIFKKDTISKTAMIGKVNIKEDNYKPILLKDCMNEFMDYKMDIGVPAHLKKNLPKSTERKIILQFIEASDRGIIKGFRQLNGNKLNGNHSK